MMTDMTKEWSYKTSGTTSCEPTQQIFGLLNIMAATGTTYALAAAMKQSFPPNRYDDSHILVPLAIYEQSFVMHTIMPIS